MSSRFVSSGTILGDGTSKPIITPAATAHTGGTASANKEGDGNATLAMATQLFATTGRNAEGKTNQHLEQSRQPQEPSQEPLHEEQPSRQIPPNNPPSAPLDEDLDPAAAARRAEWASVQATLLSERAEREAKRKAELQGEGEKSLFAILQENKAAKQAAFEEANKIRNQFRALDDDEVEFLGEVEMKKREEERMKKEEEREGMRKFQEAQRAGGGNGMGDGGEGEGNGDVKWETAGGRKRKREKDGGGGKGVFKGLKRKGSAVEGEGDGQSSLLAEKETTAASAVTRKSSEESSKIDEKTKATTAPASKPAAPKASLVAYGSDSDDD